MSLPVPVQEEIKRGVSDGVKGLILGKIIEGATKNGVEKGLVAGAQLGRNVALNTLIGSAGGGIAGSILSEAVRAAPGLAKTVALRMGYQGYERGQEAAILELFKTLKEAGGLEMLGYLGSLIAYNPSTRFIRNGVGVAAAGGLTYWTAKKLLSIFEQTSRDRMSCEFLSSQISKKLEKLHSSGKMTDLILNRYQMEAARNYNLVDLTNLQNRLNDYY